MRYEYEYHVECEGCGNKQIAPSGVNKVDDDSILFLCHKCQGTDYKLKKKIKRRLDDKGKIIPEDEVTVY